MGDLWNYSVTYFVSCYNVSQWLQHIGRAEDHSFELQYLVQTFTLVRFHIVWTLGHTHPHRDCHKSGLGKCWAAQLSFMKNGGNGGEVDRNSRRGSHTVKRVAHVGFKGCLCVSGWPSHYQSPACPLCKGLSSHAGPHPLSLRQQRQAAEGAGEWWPAVQCSGGYEAVFTVYFLPRLW